MFGFFTKARTIGKYLPILIATIQVIEDLMGDKPGEEKKKRVLDYIKNQLSEFTDLGDSQIKEVTEFLDSSVDFFVMLLNELGVFEHKGKGSK